MAQYPSLHGRAFAVTGGGAGIGESCVRELLSQGSYISVLDSNGGALETLAERLPHEHRDRFESVAGDVSDEETVRGWLEAYARRHGRLSGVVAAAGIEPRSDDAADALDTKVWSKVLSVNLDGLLYTFKTASRLMLDANVAGSLVYIGSPTGFYGCELGHHAYSASKGGGFGLARVMATEYARANIRVNVIWPGFIATRMNAEVLADPVSTSKVESMIPLGRAGRAAEIASAATFLLSDDASYCTGTVLTVDGGLTAYAGGVPFT